MADQSALAITDGHELRADFRNSFFVLFFRNLFNFWYVVAEKLLHVFQGFAFGLRQKKIDKNDARQSAASEDEEGHIFAQSGQHVGEESDDNQSDDQVERRRNGAQKRPVSGGKQFTHDDEGDITQSARISRHEDHQRYQRQPAQMQSGIRFAPDPLEVEKYSHGRQRNGSDGSRPQ